MQNWHEFVRLKLETSKQLHQAAASSIDLRSLLPQREDLQWENTWIVGQTDIVKTYGRRLKEDRLYHLTGI